MAKSLNSERVNHAFGHPHERAVRKLIDALLALLPPPSPLQAAAEEEGEVTAVATSQEGEGAAADATQPVAAAPAQQSAVESGRRGVFSEKQCEVIRGWSMDFDRSLRADREGRGLGGNAAGPGRRLGGDGPPSSMLDSMAEDVDVVEDAPPPGPGAMRMSERERRLAALARRGL